MKILVLSDSHGNGDAMLKATERESPDLILHLGDHDRDCAVIEREYPEIPLRSVRGNCDRMSVGVDCDEFLVAGKRFFMTHGHMYGVKSGMTSIIQDAVLRGADVLLFGHTHISHYCVENDMSIINPGSISMFGKTYAVVELENGAISCDIRKLKKLFS